MATSTRRVRASVATSIPMTEGACVEHSGQSPRSLRSRCWQPYGLIATTKVEQGLDVPLIRFAPVITPDAVKIAGSA